jgi:hypothetical protein
VFRDDGGLLHLREDPANPGTFYATQARELPNSFADLVDKHNTILMANHGVATGTAPPMNPARLAGGPRGK